MNELDKGLEKILSEFRSCQKIKSGGFEEDFSEVIKAIKQSFKEASYATGQEWLNRFIAEYHNKADWIAGDKEMGEDAEYDVLLAAKLASGVK